MRPPFGEVSSPAAAAAADPAAAARSPHRRRPGDGQERRPPFVPAARRYTIDGLQHMGRDLGILSPVAYAVTCEAKQDMFRQERNALICGASRLGL